MEDLLDRRRFLLAATMAMAACDRVVLNIEGGGDVLLDEDGNAYIPEITPNEAFYVYQFSRQPEDLDPDAWTLTFGQNRSQRIDKAFLETLEPRDIELTLQCIGASVTSRRIGNAVWTGLPLSEVLDAAGIPGPPASTVEIAMRGADGYDASIPVSDYEDAPIWLIWGMNGEELPFDHGAPARLMIPGRYGVKNIKWITDMWWTDSRYEGHWDQYGWSHEAPYDICGFIHWPEWDAEVEKPVQVIGSAFAGRDPIKKVELTANGGKSWIRCQLDYAPGPDKWTLWSCVWHPKKTGEHEIQVRATSKSGQVTSMNPSGTHPLKGYNGGQLLPLTVV